MKPIELRGHHGQPILPGVALGECAIPRGIVRGTAGLPRPARYVPAHEAAEALPPSCLGAMAGVHRAAMDVPGPRRGDGRATLPGASVAGRGEVAAGQRAVRGRGRPGRLGCTSRWTKSGASWRGCTADAPDRGCAVSTWKIAVGDRVVIREGHDDAKLRSRVGWVHRIAMDGPMFVETGLCLYVADVQPPCDRETLFRNHTWIAWLAPGDVLNAETLQPATGVEIGGAP